MSDVISASELAAMQALANQTLPGTAVITRRSSWASDGAGGGTAPYAAVGTAPCRVAPTGQQPTADVIGAAVQARAMTMVTFAVGVDVQNGDRIVSGGHTFEVVKAVVRDRAITLRVVCVEIGGS